MANTLGLDDEWDPIDVVVAVEKAFDIKIADKEAEAVITVGDFFGLLQQKLLPSKSVGKCASAMAFYRVRRALDLIRPDTKLVPSSDLSGLDRAYTKMFTDEVNLMQGLALPEPEATGIGKLGCVMWLLAIIAPFAIIVLKLPGWMAFGAIGLFWMTAWQLGKADPGHLPKHCRSMDELVEKTALHNYGRLIRQGADARPQAMWRVLTQVLAEMSSLPAAEMTRDTICLRSKFDELYD